MTLSQKLTNAGFTKAEDNPKPRLIITIHGLEKQGKTHFALTTPAPIAYFGIDSGAEGVLRKYLAQGKNIISLEEELEVQNTQSGAKKEWDRFMVADKAAKADKSIRTIVYDTATELWELLRFAQFGKVTQVMPYQYTPVNAEFRRFLRSGTKTDKNIILLQKMKKQYIGDKWNGKYERAGFGDMGFIVQVIAEVYRDSVDDGGEFNIYIEDCRQNPEMMGELYSGDFCNFPFLAGMILDLDEEVFE